jgi:formylglycine-generating enzyme required for sulfatase activity
VLRGGSYAYGGSGLRCASRGRHNPDYWIVIIGFRVVVSSFPISLLRSGS